VLAMVLRSMGLIWRKEKYTGGEKEDTKVRGRIGIDHGVIKRRVQKRKEGEGSVSERKLVFAYRHKEGAIYGLIEDVEDARRETELGCLKIEEE